jgi:hypothetical protein
MFPFGTAPTKADRDHGADKCAPGMSWDTGKMCLHIVTLQPEKKLLVVVKEF